MLEFKKYLQEQNTVGYHNDGPGAPILNSDATGSETPNSYFGNPNFLPSLDMGLPTVTRSSRIIQVERHKNPIFVMLQDGTKLYFTYDEFKRIKGSEPKVGKTLQVVFQRSPDDSSGNHSQIQSCYCN